MATAAETWFLRLPGVLPALVILTAAFSWSRQVLCLRLRLADSSVDWGERSSRLNSTSHVDSLTETSSASVVYSDCERGA